MGRSFFLTMITMLYCLFSSSILNAKIPFSYFKDTDFFQGHRAVLNPIHGALVVESNFLDKLYDFPIDGESDLKTAQELLKSLFHKTSQSLLKPSGLNKPSFYFSPTFLGTLSGTLHRDFIDNIDVQNLDKQFIEDSQTQLLLLQAKHIYCKASSQTRVRIEVFKSKTDLCSRDDRDSVEWKDLHSTFKKRVHKIYRLLFSDKLSSFLNLRILQGLLWHRVENKAAYANYLSGILSSAPFLNEGVDGDVETLAWLNSRWHSNDLSQTSTQISRRFSPSAFNQVAATFLQKFKRQVYFTPIGVAKVGSKLWMDCGENSIRNFFAILISRETSQDLPSYSLDKLVGLKNEPLFQYFTNYFSFKEGDTCSSVARNKFAEICSGHDGVAYRSSTLGHEVSSEQGAHNILKLVSSILLEKGEPSFSSWHDLEHYLKNVIPDFNIIQNNINSYSGYGFIKFRVSGGEFKWTFQKSHFEIQDSDTKLSETLEVRQWLGHHMLARFPQDLSGPEKNIAYFDHIILASLSPSDSNDFYQNMGISDRRNFLFLSSTNMSESLDILEGLQDEKLLSFWADYVQATSSEVLDLAIATQLQAASTKLNKVKILCQSSTRLNLRAKKLNSSSLRMLAGVLKTNTSIISLNLSSNNMTDSGLTELLEGLRENTTLEYLNLSRNHITSIGLQKLKDLATIGHRRFSHINLLENFEISNQDAEELLSLHRDENQ